MRNRIIAALFAFFLGGFGAHKFYLGQTGWGILYLVFCWTFIPSVAGFVEFVILLTTSDQAFDRRFNQGILPNYDPLQQAQSIEKLNDLRIKGLITDEEFEAKRRQFLERM